MGSTLQLQWYAVRDGERRFLDYVVDGESLFELHGSDDNLVSPLGWTVPEWDEQVARRLLGEEPPDFEGRVSIWVCVVCGEIECGAITARTTHDVDEVVWWDFAFTYSDYADGVVCVQQPRPWAPIRFDAPSYRAAIEGRPAAWPPSK
jgi:hypothetical protein